MIAAIGLLGAGFWQFVSQIDRQALAVANKPKADAIVVLTGGRARLDAAVRLLSEGCGKRLLISGVHAEVSEETLRSTLGVSQVLYDCCIDIDRDALDTTGNAVSSAQWVRSNGFESLIVVTNDYHMPRSMLEMRRALPELTMTAYPVINTKPKVGALSGQMDRYRVLIGEYAKYLIVAVRRPIG